jgi:hypothetical protein
MYRLLSFLGALVALALGACDGAPAPDLAVAPAGGSAAEAAHSRSPSDPSDGLAPIRFTLGQGQTRTFGETASSLTFAAVVSDTRCPLSVECVRAGEARTRFTFRNGDGTEYAVGLAIPGGSPLELSTQEVAPAFAGGYAFRLIRLQPYPGRVTDVDAPATATVVVEPCTERCFEVYPTPEHP